MTLPGQHNRTKKTMLAAFQRTVRFFLNLQDVIGPRSHGYDLGDAGGGIGMAAVNTDQPGVTPDDPIPTASKFIGPITIAASGSYDHPIGPDTGYQGTRFTYSWNKNSKIGIGDGRMFSNQGAATDGANIVGETREESSQLTFSAVRAAGVLYLRIANGDGANSITLIFTIDVFKT